MKNSKILKLLIINLLLIRVVAYCSNSYYKVDLYKFANIVSANANVNILIDNKVKANEISFYLPKPLKKFDWLKAFNDLLKDNNLILAYRKGYYYVTYLNPKKSQKHLYSYHFKNLDLDNTDFIKSFFPNIQLQFLKNSNSVYFYSVKNNYSKVINILKKIDKPHLQKKISLSIYTINLTKAKSLGFEISKFGLSLSDLISFTDKSITLSTNNLLSYQSAINFLISKGAVNILQNPIINLTDSKKVQFESVLNIPYKSSVTTVKDNTVSTQENISYKDVGLKIAIDPRVFKDHLSLNLSLTSENILDKTDTPTTSKLVYNNSFNLDLNSSLLLTGLNVVSNSKTTQKVPILGYLPMINPLFSNTKIDKSTQVLTILIKVIK